jgi:phosphodiesterase/alkaline phosphatase D-like protein
MYRTDAGLRELHRLHPALHVWDDHEVADNYTDNRPAPAALQRNAGYRAAFEWVPRVVEPRERHRIYRRLAFGTTAEIFLLDGRQYRTGDGDGQPRRILGETQMRWLVDGLLSSRARWKVVAQQVPIAANPFGDGSNRDRWDGYPEDRARLLGAIEAAGLRDVVFLTGDAHVFSCNLLAADFAALGDGSGRTAAAVEYIGGSVTSPGRDYPEARVQAASPWNRQFNGSARGYSLAALDGGRLVTEYRRSDISSATGGTVAFERFTQEAGTNAVVREPLG